MKRFECKAILFDLDGVLVDSTSYVEEQWRRWARAKGLKPEPFLRVCHGRRALETIRLAAPELDAEAEVAAFIPDDIGRAGITLAPVKGASAMLSQLPAGSWAVATSGPRVDAEERLRRAGLPMPDVFVCAEDVLHGKPNPDVYLQAAIGLGISPADCLVIEDAPAGIEAAKAAGMRVVALTTTHPAAELRADACVATLADLHLDGVERSPNRPSTLALLVHELD